jgi:RNA polymerase sigma factor (sigma-70 family)
MPTVARATYSWMSLPTPVAAFTPTLQRPSTTPIELARRAADGNQPATGRLLKNVAPKVIGAVRAVLGGAHPDVDDVVQLALIGFVQALPAFRGDCDPAGYARVIAVRTAIATKKRERTMRARHDFATELDDLSSTRPLPSDVADADARKELVRDLLGDLPEEQAETLALRVGLGWSIEEIAQESAVPINTVRSRLRLAKERMRERIEKNPRLREIFGRE